MTDTLLQRVAAALVSRPLVYDLVQTLAGQARVAERLRGALARVPPPRRVVDVGSAAGGFAQRLGIRPVCVDLDPRPLAALRRRTGTAPAVAADASRLPFRDAAFDLALCVAVLHHLDDATAPRVIAELERVSAGRVLFLEPLRNDRRRVSRWLWRYDRGRHPRTRDELLALLEPAFRVEEAVEFSVYHEYLLCRTGPRPKGAEEPPGLREASRRPPR